MKTSVRMMHVYSREGVLDLIRQHGDPSIIECDCGCGGFIAWTVDQMGVWVCSDRTPEDTPWLNRVEKDDGSVEATLRAFGFENSLELEGFIDATTAAHGGTSAVLGRMFKDLRGAMETRSVNP